MDWVGTGCGDAAVERDGGRNTGGKGRDPSGGNDAVGCCRLWTGGGSRRLCSWKGEGRPVCDRGISFAVWCHVDRGAGNI